MKVEKTGRFIVGVLVVLVGCSHVWAGWSAPVLLSELNGPNGETAYSPALSSDGLTIYFHREIASLGQTCIVEAHRETADGPFTSERVMTELITTGYELIAPWVSQDNLRLYYRERPAAGIPRIKMAERPSTSEAWVPAVRIFDELHVDEANANQPALTADELTIFFYSTRPGGSGGYDLWMAIRGSTEETFGNPRPLYELNTTAEECSPHVLPDGLTLYFHGKNRDGYVGNNIFRATRTSTIAIFGNAELVELPRYETHQERNPYVTPDEQTIYYGGGVDEEQGIWVSYWVDEPDAGKALSPCLSSDGLAMYSARYDSSLEHTCIVEASRSVPAGEFSSQRILSELDVSGGGVDGPWISQDGLRLYYQENTAGTNKIKMAQRSSTSETWAPTRTFEELHNENHAGEQPCLTADELRIFFHSGRSGGAGGQDLWTGTRTSVEGSFMNIRPLYEINTTGDETGAHVSSNGLTLYFTSQSRAGHPADQLFRAMRQLGNETFNNVRYVEFANNVSAKYNCYVTPDDKIVYFAASGGGIYMSRLRDAQWVLDTVTSAAVDAGDPAMNPVNERMPNGGRLNMGAYGGTSSGSLSAWAVKGDVNRDGIVNLADCVLLLDDWMSRLPWAELN